MFSIFAANSSRRQSLDILWAGGTGERVKELLSHGMMMLNISSLTERRSSEPRVTEKDKEKADKAEKAEAKGKKVPSPLEKSMSYLNPEEETSDSESLARFVSHLTPATEFLSLKKKNIFILLLL